MMMNQILQTSVVVTILVIAKTHLLNAVISLVFLKENTELIKEWRKNNVDDNHE